MNLSLHIARRYLFSKKSHNAINIISLISVIGVCFVSMSLVVVLSVFNGFEDLVVSLYNAFDPDIKVTPFEGKTIEQEAIDREKIKNIQGVVHYSEVIEENALLKYKDKQYIARIKGVDEQFLEMSGIDSMIVGGELLLKEGGQNFAVLGQGVAYYLSASLSDYINPINIYVPKRGVQGTLNPSRAFEQRSIFPSGIFAIQQDFDVKYVLVPLDFARDILNYQGEISTIELGLAQGADAFEVKESLQEYLGDGYEVKTRFEQHELLYKILKSEKWAVYLILTFILIIAIFNVIGSLTMLILDKKKDIAILKSMGANNYLIRSIFLSEGMMITLSGAVLGLVFGLLLCYAQVQFGLVKLQGSGSFVIDAYPVVVQPLDLLYVFLTVFAIGFIASIIPVRQIVKDESTVRIAAE